jgi:hypothetical protein
MGPYILGHMTEKSPGEPPELTAVFKSMGFENGIGFANGGPGHQLGGGAVSVSDAGLWDADVCCQKFAEIIRTRDDHGIWAAMEAMDRLNCWPAALAHVAHEAQDYAAIRENLLWFWIGCGFRIASSLKNELPILVDALRQALPPYIGPGDILYRGELAARHEAKIYGIAWSTNRAIAQMYADRRMPDEGEGVILCIDAPAAMIVADVQAASWLNERECIVDPRLVRSVEVVPWDQKFADALRDFRKK